MSTTKALELIHKFGKETGKTSILIYHGEEGADYNDR